VAKTERVTVTLAAGLVESIDRLERNRSRFIAEAIEHELARRRQESLLQSIRRPHADTVALVDTGLSEWMSDLPADEGLVDVAAGTPVRWVEGQGWTKGRS
jgi:post-segregation antitoxin (ccd killing protein)